MESIRVLIADDHPVFREGLRSLLSSVKGVEVAGEAATGRQAVRAAHDLQPDVVVMDLHMPELSGVEAVRQIAHDSPHIRTLVLTMFDDDDSLFAAMRAGAAGYLLKEADQSEIVRAIQSVADGEAIFGPGVARRVMAYFAQPRAAAQPKPFPQLTERETEVLELIAQGKGNQAIAHHLSISHKTVRNHVSNIFAKLHVADRAEAIVRAREAGLGQGGPRTVTSDFPT